MKKKILALICFAISLAPLTAKDKIVPTIYQNTDIDAMNHWVDSVFNTLSLDQKIGQLFIAVVPGTSTEANKQSILAKVESCHLGGLLFSKGDPLTQASLTNAAQASSKVPLMITLDGEWGLAMRLKNTTYFPHNMMLGAIQSDSLIHKYGEEVARQCKLMGIHVNFAPDIDVNSNPKNPVIGNRSFGENPYLVAKCGIMYAKGLEKGGVMAVAKHFPGHGDTSTDSHHTLPRILHDRARLDSVELYPFKEYINAGLSSVMIGHLDIPVLDSEKQPSSLSKKIVTDLLKDELGFSGLVFTDGLQMRGVSLEENHCVRALLAGNDILLGPTYLEKEYKAVKRAVEENEISQELINDKCKRVLAYKYILGLEDYQPIETEGLDTKLNTAYANWLNRKLYQKAVTLLKNDAELIPFKTLDEKKVAVVTLGSSVDSQFAQSLNKYMEVTRFSAVDKASLNKLKTELSTYNTIIFAIHNNKVRFDNEINELSKNKKTVMSFFTVPYEMGQFKKSIKTSSAVVLAYENAQHAQEFAAQAIFGGSLIDGRLPVSVDSLFNQGDGLDVKKKIRLGYGIPEDVGLKSSLGDSIAQIIKYGIEEKAYPGGQILIAKNGIVIYDQSFGAFEYDSLRLVKGDDIYDLASMTKGTATVPALMKLYDEGLISVNDSLSKYIPVLKGTNKSGITLKDALFHESRLVSYFPYYMDAIDKKSYVGNLFNRQNTELYNAKLDANTWARTDYKYKETIISKTEKEGFLPISENLYVNKAYKDTIIGKIAESNLRKRKGYMYSCLNFMLIKEVIEKKAGKDLNTFVQDTYFKKLGADATSYNPLTRFDIERIAPTEKDDFLRHGIVKGYVHDEGAAFMGGISGNAGLFSNANDLVKLYQMWLNKGEYGGERFLSAKTCQFFTTTKSSISRRGLGFDKPEPQTNKPSPTSISTPLNTYGHTGFTGTCFWIDPDNDLIYIFLSNRIYPSRTHTNLMKLNIRTDIQEAIYKEIRAARKGK